MQPLMIILSIAAILQITSCKPNPIPGDITRDVKVNLPGFERINRRSAEDYLEDSTSIISDPPTDDDSQENDDASIYDPTDSDPSDEVEAFKSREEFALAESNVVFQPLFVSKQDFVSKNRNTRSADGIQTDSELSSSSIASDARASSGAGVAENGMVFRSRNPSPEKPRLRRSAENVSGRVTESNSDLKNAQQAVEVKPELKHKVRPVRSALGKSTKNGDDLLDDMVLAENGLIFRPVFRNRQRDGGSS